MAAARAVLLIVVAISALTIGVFVGGSIAQPALLRLMPWSTATLHSG